MGVRSTDFGVYTVTTVVRLRPGLGTCGAPVPTSPCLLRSDPGRETLATPRPDPNVTTDGYPLLGVKSGLERLIFGVGV